jgi:tRNA-binding protein
MNSLEPAAPTSVENFFACDLRVGTVLACELNAKARKPAYKLTLDFGPLGRKTSSAQITERYRPEDLLGKQVVAVVNFPPRKVADVLSECLVLAVDGPGGLVTLGVDHPVANGVRIY